jgi:ATP-binding cassette, subfamily B, bacterial PglK
MVDQHEKVPARAIYGLLPRPFRIKFIFAIALRILTNFLDMGALAGVAILALAISGLTSSKGGGQVKLPLVGSVTVTDSTALLIAMSIVVLFIVKSIVSLWFMTWIGRLAARCEAIISRSMLINYFGSNLGTRVPLTQSEISAVFLMSLTSLLSGSIVAFVTICAEGTLLVLLVATFLLINPFATLMLCVYFGIILGALNWVSASAIRKVTRQTYDVSLSTVTASRNLFSVEKELYTLGLAGNWIDRVISLRSRYAGLAVSMSRNNSLPRYVVESGLVIGIFIFIGSIMLFSDLPSQSLTIGIFLTGGFRLVSSVLPLQAAVNSWRQALVTGRPAFDILNQNRSDVDLEVAPESTPASEVGIEVSIENLRVVNPEGGQPLLDSISLKLPAGSKVAITGPSGAGKSTLLSALLGIHKANGGEIFLDGLPMREYHQRHKGQVAYVPQMPILISGSIVDNITLSPDDSQVDIARVSELLEKLGLQDRVNELQDGIETLLSPDVKLLSGGEIQRIGLARALYWKPRLLLLDEVTSALDSVTEDKIASVIDELRGRVTIVMVSHREEPISNSDVRVVLDRGQLV